MFIDVFKLCTFPTDHTKEFAGKSVHSGKRHGGGEGTKEKSQEKIEKIHHRLPEPPDLKKP